MQAIPGAADDQPPAAARPLSTDLRYDDVDFTVENGSYFKILQLIGANQRVLELGTATGRTTQALRAAGCTVVGLEYDADAAALASAYCERVIVADLDAFDAQAVLGDDAFDIILAADVLEHLKDPGALLRRLRPFLSEGGRLVLSLPNVAHGSVRLALLEGRFPYADHGLLDRTHLRFFTESGVSDLLAGAGFTVQCLERVTRGIEETEVTFTHDQNLAHIYQLLANEINALTYQFVLSAVADEPSANAVATAVEERGLAASQVPAWRDADSELLAAQARQIELLTLQTRTTQAALDAAEERASYLDAALRDLVGSKSFRLAQGLRRIAGRGSR